VVSFDNIDHEWMVKFLQHRITDTRVLRLIQKWLRAGVSEQGQWSETKVGTPQGAVISPLLANVYLHYVFDLWVEAWRNKGAGGDVIVIRYADDFVLGFEQRAEAERFLRQLRERLAKFGLELHPEKTRLIEFGRFAGSNRNERGAGKPETFDFLGFTHICGKNPKTGYFEVRRKTVGKRLAKKLQEIKQQLRRRMHEPPAQTGKWLRSVVQGYFNYHAIPGKRRRLCAFRSGVIRQWRGMLARRSQKARLRWARMTQLIRCHIPTARLVHPFPNVRFDAMHPR
jgi:group II intron reverse transcriptase/maturase